MTMSGAAGMMLVIALGYAALLCAACMTANL